MSRLEVGARPSERRIRLSRYYALRHSRLRHMDAEKIKDHLSRLRRAAPDVFGANSHRFLLNESLGEGAVRHFEIEAGVELPGDYREFIAFIGNGGAGPYYGVFKIGTMEDPGHDCGSWHGDVGTLASPFPYSLERSVDGVFVTGPLGYRRRYRDTNTPNEYANADWHTGPVDGALPICHMGCGYFVWLVISGDEAGHLWYDGRAAEQGFEPILDQSGSSITFARWYEEWLDASLNRVPQ